MGVMGPSLINVLPPTPFGSLWIDSRVTTQRRVADSHSPILVSNIMVIPIILEYKEDL